MPTKDNKDFDDVNGGFEFESVPSWDDVEEEKPGSAEKTEFETDFSTLDFGGTTENESPENDSGFGFNFDAMPTEQSVSADQHRGDPSAEFEEFGITQDEFSSNDTGFGVSDDDVSTPSSPEEANQFDEFDQAFSAEGVDHGYQSTADNSYYDDATAALTSGQYLGAEDDPYSQVQNEQHMPHAPHADSGSAAQKSLLSKLILPVGIGAIVLVGGFIGYTSLLSSSAPAPEIVAQTPVVDQPQFPSVLPPEQTAQSPVTIPASSETEVASNSTLKQPNEPQELTFDLPTDTSVNEIPSLQMPTADSKPDATLPVEIPVAQLPDQNPVETVTPVKETASEVSYKDTPAESGNLPAAEDIALKSELKDVLDRLTSLEAKVDDLADSFSANVAVPVQTPSAEVDSGFGLNSKALPVASIDNIDPPLKPIVIDGLKLVGVSGDTAWINTGKDVISVKKSDALPNGGKVEDIRQYRGDWVLVATDGIVLR